MRPIQVIVSEFSSAYRSRSTSYSFVYALFSSMASGWEIVPVGETDAVLYDDTWMNGGNGPVSPIIIKPGDRERADRRDAGACILYVRSLIPLDSRYGGRGQANSFYNKEYCPWAIQIRDIDGGVPSTADCGSSGRREWTITTRHNLNIMTKCKYNCNWNVLMAQNVATTNKTNRTLNGIIAGPHTPSQMAQPAYHQLVSCLSSVSFLSTLDRPPYDLGLCTKSVAYMC